MERLVLGYDGSAAAESALDWVSDRAAQRAVLIEIVSVGNLFHTDASHVDRLLAHAEQRLRTRIPGQPVETSRFHGSAARTLTASAEDADLLVIGVDTAHPLRSAAHGWIPQRVGAVSVTPVCIVPAGWSPAQGAVTVGLDDDGSSQLALEFAAAEASAGGVDLRVVHAWSLPVADGEHGPTPSPRQVLGEHRELATEAVEQLRRNHPALSISLELEHDNPTAALSASALRSSLIVIGTHGRGILGGGWVGSVALDLIGTLPTPICVVLTPSSAQ